MENPAMEKLLKKIVELQKRQDQLHQEISRLKVSAELRKQSPRRNTCDEAPQCSRRNSTKSKQPAGKLTSKQYLNVLQSISQSVHVVDLNSRIVFWSSMSEKVYGYSAKEAIGKNPINFIVDEKDAAFAKNVARRCCVNRETWNGKFPVKTKSGRMVSALTTCSPFYDDHGSLIGIITVTNNKEPYLIN